MLSRTNARRKPKLVLVHADVQHRRPCVLSASKSSALKGQLNERTALFEQSPSRSPLGHWPVVGRHFRGNTRVREARRECHRHRRAGFELNRLQAPEPSHLCEHGPEGRTAVWCNMIPSSGSRHQQGLCAQNNEGPGSVVDAGQPHRKRRWGSHERTNSPLQYSPSNHFNIDLTWVYVHSHQCGISRKFIIK